MDDHCHGKHIRLSVKYANTVSEIWTDLEERFDKESAPRAYELKQSLTRTRKEGTAISSYYMKLRSIWDEIQLMTLTPRCECAGCTCDIGKRLNQSKDKERIYEFLMGLDNEYSTIKTPILALKPAPSLDATYHLVIQEEHQRAIIAAKKPTNEATTFQAFIHGKKEIGGDHSQQNKNAVQKDPKQGNNDESECTFSRKKDHNKKVILNVSGIRIGGQAKENKKKER